jgi:hypothetical protein
MTAFQRRNFEAWGTSLEIAFSKKSSGYSFYFLTEKTKGSD